MPNTVGVAIMSLNGLSQLQRLVGFLASEKVDKLLVCDSSSTDGTLEWCKEQQHIDLLVVQPGEFNHGATRELARSRLGTEIAVLLTQDVLPKPGFLSALVRPVVAGEAAVAYARQLPNEGADIFEAFPRDFNYPSDSHRRTIEDAATQGVYAFFCSDSCSAYLNAALDEIGGFEPTLTNEDYFAVAKLLQRGGSIAYVAEAEVHHSHRYNLLEELKRSFDTGYVRAENPWVTELVGHAERRGIALSSGLLKELLTRKPMLLPYAIAHLSVKWLGYRLGFLGYRYLSRKSCRSLSSQPYYWTSRFCRHPRP